MSTVVSNKKRKKKIQNEAVTLEQVFQQISSIKSTSLVVDSELTINLTPRSKQACINLGVNPEGLKARDLHSFLEDGLDDEISQIRHDAYTKRRYDLMKKCMKERSKIMESESQIKAPRPNDLTDKSAADKILEAETKRNSEVLQQEMIRVRKLKERQEKEISNMTRFILFQSQVQKDLQHQLEEENRKRLEEKQAFERRLKDISEQRRMREIHHSVMGEIEQQTRQEKARELHERDKALEFERQRRLLEVKKQLQLESIRKMREHEEQKYKLEKYFIEEQLRLREKLSSIDEAEKRKNEVIHERQRLLQLENCQKRSVLASRIERNRDMANFIEQKRKEDILQKQHQHELKRAMMLAREEQDRRLATAAQEIKDEQRRQILIAQDDAAKAEADRLVEKFNYEQKLVEEVSRKKAREMEIAKERRRVRNQLKEDNKLRAKRVNEKLRRDIEKKITTSDSRIDFIVSERAKLVEQRRRVAAEARLMKEKISGLLEELRNHPARLSACLTNVAASNAQSITVFNQITRLGETKKHRNSV